MHNINGRSRNRGSSDETRSSPRLSSSESVIDGLSDLRRIDIIDGASSSKMAADDYWTVDYIPEWLLLNVLIRLPSKFVIRFKLVSKRWASLISDPFFVHSYLSHSSTSPSSSWTVIEKHMDHRYKQKAAFIESGSMPNDKFSKQNFGALYVPSTHRHESYIVLGESNGLILFGMACYRTTFGSTMCNLLHVCNPMTRKLISLSPQPRGCPIECRRWGFVARVEDAVLKSFRVVLLMPDGETGLMRSSVYASETREWSDFLLSNARYVSKNRPTALNQILHWDEMGGSVVAYDPYENPHDVRIIAAPKDVDERDTPVIGARFRQLCGALGGKLRYLERFPISVCEDGSTYRFKLWVLEDYASGTWCVSHKSDHLFRKPMLSHLTTMFFDPFDSDVLYLMSGKRLVSYDVKSGKFEVERRAGPKWGALVLEVTPWPVSITP